MARKLNSSWILVQFDPIVYALLIRVLQEFVLKSLGQKLRKFSPGPVNVFLRKILVTMELFSLVMRRSRKLMQ